MKDCRVVTLQTYLVYWTEARRQTSKYAAFSREGVRYELLLAEDRHKNEHIYNTSQNNSLFWKISNESSSKSSFQSTCLSVCLPLSLSFAPVALCQRHICIKRVSNKSNLVDGVKGRTRKIRHVEYSRHPTPRYNMTCLTNHVQLSTKA